MLLILVSKALLSLDGRRRFLLNYILLEYLYALVFRASNGQWLLLRSHRWLIIFAFADLVITQNRLISMSRIANNWSLVWTIYDRVNTAVKSLLVILH